MADVLLVQLDLDPKKFSANLKKVLGDAETSARKSGQTAGENYAAGFEKAHKNIQNSFKNMEQTSAKTSKNMFSGIQKEAKYAETSITNIQKVFTNFTQTISKQQTPAFSSLTSSAKNAQISLRELETTAAKTFTNISASGKTAGGATTQLTTGTAQALQDFIKLRLAAGESFISIIAAARGLTGIYAPLQSANMQAIAGFSALQAKAITTFSGIATAAQTVSGFRQLEAGTRNAATSFGNISLAATGAFRGIDAGFVNTGRGAATNITSIASHSTGLWSNMRVAGAGALSHLTANFQNWANSSNNSISSVSSSLKLIGGGAAVIGVGKAFQQIVTSGMDFDKSMNAIQATSRATDEEMEKLRQTAKALGEDETLVGVSAAQAGNAMLELVRGGMSIDEAASSARGTLQLMTAAQESSTQAAIVQSQAINAFGLSASDASTVADQLSNTIDASALSMTDIQGAFQNGARTIGLLNIPMDEYLTTLTMMNQKGIGGAEAASALNSALNALLTPTKEQTAAADRLGVSIFDASGKFVGLEEMMQQLKVASKGMTDEAFSKEVSMLLGSYGLSIGSIAKSMPDETSFGVLEQGIKASGTAAEKAEAQTKGLPGIWNDLSNNVEQIWLGIYEKIEPLLTKIGDGFIKITDGIKGMLETDPEHWSFIQTACASLAISAAAFGGFLVLSKLPAIIGAVSFALSSMMKAHPWLLAISLITGGLIMLNEKFDLVGKAIDAVKFALGWLKDRWDDVWNGIQVLFESFRTNVLDKMGEWFMAPFRAIERGGSWLKDKLGEIWGKLKGIFASPINFLIDFVYNDGILKFQHKLADWLPGIEPMGRMAHIGGYATGGQIHGPGGIDNVLMWGTLGEHVITVEEVIKAGGQGMLYTMRDLIKRGIPFQWDNGKIAGVDKSSAQNYGEALKSGKRVDPQGLYDGLLQKAGINRYAHGGEVGLKPWQIQIKRVHEILRKMNGQPYTWGGAGPYGYDCTGYTGLAVRAVLGMDPLYARLFATSSFAGYPASTPFGMIRATNDALVIGITDNPGGAGGGHSAGWIGDVPGSFRATNFESDGTNGVHYGWGTDPSSFDAMYTVPIAPNSAFIGSNVPSGEEMKSSVGGKIGEMLDEILNPIYGKLNDVGVTSEKQYTKVPHSSLDWGKNKITDSIDWIVGGLGDAISNVWTSITDFAAKLNPFDSGGVAYGPGMMFKNTIQPERILSPEQTRTFDRFVHDLDVMYTRGMAGKPLLTDQQVKLLANQVADAALASPINKTVSDVNITIGNLTGTLSSIDKSTEKLVSDDVPILGSLARMFGVKTTPTVFAGPKIGEFADPSEDLTLPFGQYGNDLNIYAGRSYASKGTRNTELSRLFADTTKGMVKGIGSYVVNDLIAPLVTTALNGVLSAVLQGSGPLIGAAIGGAATTAIAGLAIPGVGVAAGPLGALIGGIAGSVVADVASGLLATILTSLLSGVFAVPNMMLNSFDAGGEAIGKGIMVKNVLQPERTLDPSQTDMFNRLVLALEKREKGPSIQAPITINGVYAPEKTAKRLVSLLP